MLLMVSEIYRKSHTFKNHQKFDLPKWKSTKFERLGGLGKLKMGTGGDKIGILRLCAAIFENFENFLPELADFRAKIEQKSGQKYQEMEVSCERVQDIKF